MTEKPQATVPLIEIKSGRPETLMSESSRRTNASISRVRVTKMDNKKASSLLMEGKSLNTVGFKKGGIQTQRDLTHFRNCIVSKQFPEKSMNLLKNLEESIAQIPVNRYSQASAEEKFDILSRMTDAYNFAWNEGCTQIKEISNDHGKLFAKIRLFYMSLIEKYPKLNEAYNMEINDLREKLVQKDFNISVVEKELKSQIERAESTRKYIADVETEAKIQREKKRQYRDQANERSVQIEQLKSLATELRLQITILKEENERLKVQMAQKSVQVIKINENLEDKEVQVNTEFYQTKVRSSSSSIFMNNSSTASLLSNLPVKEHKKKKIKRVDSVDRLVSMEEIDSTADMHAPLRHTIFSFIDYIQEQELVERSYDEGEFKKYYWIFPKICSIFINGISLEDPQKPFTKFDQVLQAYLSNLYKTPYLVDRMTKTLIRTAHFMEEANYLIVIFNKFATYEYDFPLFRFFSTMIEFSIIYSSPDIADLVANEQIEPEISKITISPEDAVTVHKAIFPFWEPCQEFTSTDERIDYWQFMDILIQEFIKVRLHVLAFIKHGLLLSGCQDFKHITFGNFQNFVAISFPEECTGTLKPEWKELQIRYKALGNQDADTIDSQCIISFSVSKDPMIVSMMRTNTNKNFSSIFYDWNISMLKILSFIVKRLTIYVPTLKKLLPQNEELLNSAGGDIRGALFMGDLSSAVAYYRKMLHDVDTIFVYDFTNLSVTNNSSDKDIDELIKHLKLHEVVVGIINNEPS